MRQPCTCLKLDYVVVVFVVVAVVVVFLLYINAMTSATIKTTRLKFCRISLAPEQPEYDVHDPLASQDIFAAVPDHPLALSQITVAVS